MTDSGKAQEQEHLPSILDGELRQLFLELWQETRMDWGFVTDRLAKVFRRERKLASDERRFVAELLYTMVRHYSRIDLALAHGGLKSVGRAPDSKRLLACLVLEYDLPIEEAARREPAIDWNAVRSVNDSIDSMRNPVERIAARHSMPRFLVERFVREHGEDEADAMLGALNQRAPMSIRANTLKGDRDALITALREEGIETRASRYASDGLHVESRTNLFGLTAFQQGLFEAQDEGSQLIAELVAPPPKSLVVDYCAGAGGKTLALAATLNNKGRLLSSDVDARKLKELRRRVKRAGVDNVQAVELINEVGSAFPKPFEKIVGQAARVLVDAPCSGVGSMRRNPEMRWRLQESDLDRMPGIQLDIARRALELVAPGGRLIYATCTVLREENQEVVERLLADRSDLVVVSPREVWGAARGDGLVDASGNYLFTTPHRHGTDGFFAAVLRRKG